MARRYRSGHKLVERECPGCHEVKPYPARHEACSIECARILHAQRKQADAGATETHEVTGNTWTISIPNTRIHTLEQLLEAFEVDTEVWEVERFIVNKWELGRKDKRVNLSWQDGRSTGNVNDSGRVFVEPLYQVKAWLRKKVVKLSILEEIAAMKEDARRAAPKWRAVKRPKRGPSGNMLEVSVPDLHVGRMAWGEETGHGDYDIKITERIYEQAISALLERTGTYRFDEVCLIVGDDLLNVDNIENTTTSGTPVTTDTRYHKVFRVTRLMVTRAIDRLRQAAPVRVFVVPGNHDQLSAWHLGDSLECWFHGCPDVSVHNEPTYRKYHEWGRVMLMWTHGDAAKRADYPLLMATERPDLFGRTLYREAHTGHVHQVRLEETHGVRVRILPSLCAPDDWHAKRGFVGNIRSAEAYVWNKEDGLIGTATYSVPPLERNG